MLCNPAASIEKCACVRIPQTDSAVATATCDFFSIRTEYHAKDLPMIIILYKRAEVPACIHIPQVDKTYLITACNCLPIRTERNAKVGMRAKYFV